MKRISLLFIGLLTIVLGLGQDKGWIHQADSLFQVSRYRQALTFLGDMPSLPNHQMPRWHLEVGRNLTYMAQYDSAMFHFRHAKSLIGSNEQHPVLPALYDRMGEWYRWQYFDSHRAIFFSNKALALRIKYHPEDSVGLSQTYYQLGRAYNELELKQATGSPDDYQKIALQYFDKALSYSSLLQKDPNTYAWIVNRKLLCQYYLGFTTDGKQTPFPKRFKRLEELKKELLQLKAFLESRFATPHFALLQTLHNLGNFTSNQHEPGKWNSQALDIKNGVSQSSNYFDEALKQKLAIFGPAHPQVALSYHVLAYNENIVKNYSQALSYLAQSNDALFPETIHWEPETHLPVPLPDECGSWVYFAYNLRLEGEIYQEMEKVAETPQKKSAALYGALQTYKLLHDVARKIMQRRNFVYFEGIGDNSLILAGMHSARCAALLRQMGEPISSQIFLSAMDAFRANYLHSRQKQASLTRMQGDLLNINIQIDSLRMTNAADDDLNMISLLEESFALSEKCALQLLVLESQDSRKSQVYPLTIHALQKQLANNSTQLLLLNSWPDKPEETGYKSITIVESFFIGPDTTDFRIDTLLDSPTDSILGLIKAPEKHEKESYQAFCSWSHDIYHTLFRERDKLINQPNLVIIPYGPIGKIPFDLLLTKLPEVDQQLDFYRGLSYLGLDYHISYATSALSYYQDHQSQSLSLIQEAISFAPSFAVDSNQKGIKLRDMDITRMELVDLPGAARETRYMQEKLGATCITGSQASEYTFKQRASDFQLLHLATHGVAHPLAPLESRIAFSFLSKTADRMNEDGFLLARELFEMDLDNELTLISACESGQGRFAQSEGLLGLSQAFLFAGSKSVVTTYWPVPDETSANLVISFMENLSAGLPKAKALAEAKRAYLNDADSRHAHPFYWAGYSLTGDTRALEFKQDSKIDWFINVLVGIIFLFVLLFSIQRIRKQSQ